MTARTDAASQTAAGGAVPSAARRYKLRTVLIVLAVFLCSVPLLAVYRNISRFVPAITYHHIIPDGRTPASTMEVTAGRFRRDMEYLRDNGYTPLFAAELIEVKEGRMKKPARPVLITFDDGYLSNYTYAYPILRETGMKATINIVTSLVDRAEDSKSPRGEYSLINWAEAREMQQSGVVDIQSHTHNMHSDREGQDSAGRPVGLGIRRMENETKEEYTARFTEDVRLAGERIEKKAGGKMLLFCYPLGLREPWSDDVLREAGIRVTLFTSEREWLAELETFKRATITEDADLEKELAFKIS